MMDKTVQMEIIGIVGFLAALALFTGKADITSVGIAGLVGFLGGQQLQRGA